MTLEVVKVELKAQLVTISQSMSMLIKHSIPIFRDENNSKNKYVIHVILPGQALSQARYHKKSLDSSQLLGQTIYSGIKEKVVEFLSTGFIKNVFKSIQNLNVDILKQNGDWKIYGIIVFQYLSGSSWKKNGI